jgi:transcriptional regulator with XRE-family HTH domain
VTASQTRAARSLLGWNLDDLAQKADVQISAIEGIEQEIHDASTLSAIKATFEKAGIIFVGSTGVRLKHDQEKGADA